MKKHMYSRSRGSVCWYGKRLYESSPLAKELFEKANEILGYRITDLMFEGTDEDLKQTKLHNLQYFFTQLF